MYLKEKNEDKRDSQKEVKKLKGHHPDLFSGFPVLETSLRSEMQTIKGTIGGTNWVSGKTHLSPVSLHNFNNRRPNNPQNVRLQI